MFLTSRLQDWFPEDHSQTRVENLVVRSREDECGIVIKLRNGATLFIPQDDE